jgi:hypothetical protein
LEKEALFLLSDSSVACDSLTQLQPCEFKSKEVGTSIFFTEVSIWKRNSLNRKGKDAD